MPSKRRKTLKIAKRYRRLKRMRSYIIEGRLPQIKELRYGGK